MIEFKNVTKKYGDFVAVENINLKIENTSIFALTGFNGSGKTTLLSIASGAVRATSGAVLLDGSDAFDNDEERKALFYAADDMWFPPTSDVLGSAKYYALNYKNFDFDLFNSILDIFEIKSDLKIKSLSKGMKKQVQLAIAFSSKPKYLLIDETFDGLDPHKKDLLKKIILEYISETEASVIIASHNLQEVSDICDHVVILKGKSVVLNTSIEDVSDSFRKVYATFSNEISEKSFENIKYHSLKISGKAASITVYGNVEEEIEKIKKLGTETIDAERLTLEEVFIEETEAENKNEKIKSLFKK